jgi:hypothetical protein
MVFLGCFNSTIQVPWCPGFSQDLTLGLSRVYPRENPGLKNDFSYFPVLNKWNVQYVSKITVEPIRKSHVYVVTWLVHHVSNDTCLNN